MSTGRWLRFGLCLVAVAALLLLVVAARPAAASSGGIARWAQLAGDGIAPNDIAGPDDDPVVSFTTPGTVGPNCNDGTDIHYGVGDMVLYWAKFECWLPWFDAEGSGLPAGTDINALHDECGPTEPRCDLYFVFAKAQRVPDVGRVQPHDIVGAQWVEGTQDIADNFWLVFDGSDVGLTTASERIDALFLFDEDRPPAYAHCAELGLGSTVGNYRVRDQWGNWLTGGGEDILGFCASSLGPDTAGYWFIYHDGSAEGMPRHALIGLAREEGNKAIGRFNFLTKGPFQVDQADGGAGDVFEFSTYNDSIYRGPLLRFAEDTGAAGVPDSIHIYYFD